METNKRKKWRYAYRRFGITQTFNIEDTKERGQISVMEVKKVTYGENYEGSQILFLESRAQSLPLQICLSFFTIYSGSNFW